MSNKSKKEEKDTQLETEEILDQQVEQDNDSEDSENDENVNEDDAQIEKLENELSESKDKYLRLFSEFENYKRRTAKEKIELIQSANAELIESLLPAIDDFGRALSSMSDDTDVKTVQEGVELINQKINKVLEQKGLKVMDTKPGSEFDPEIHEAITQIPAPDEKLKGKIVDTIEKGYFLGEKVVRFAKVVVGN